MGREPSADEAGRERGREGGHGEGGGKGRSGKPPPRSSAVLFHFFCHSASFRVSHVCRATRTGQALKAHLVKIFQRASLTAIPFDQIASCSCAGLICTVSRWSARSEVAVGQRGRSPLPSAPPNYRNLYGHSYNSGLFTRSASLFLGGFRC